MAGNTAGLARGEGPGAELSRERERQGLTQQQVAEQLNLDVSAVEWIEHDDFAALGAPVFAKGHLRRYATLLGLPPEELLAAYEQSGTHPSQPTLIPKAREELVPSRTPPRWPLALAGIAGALLVAALAAFVVERWAERGAERGGPATPAITTAEPTPDMSAEPPAEQIATAVPSAPAADRAGDGTRVSLRLTFGEDSWVEVYDGSGAAVLYDLGSKGTERTVHATPPLSVTIGDPASVAVYLNGKRLAVPASPSGQTLTRFSIDATGAVR
jgi:cytoskeleton protein RodZ